MFIKYDSVDYGIEHTKRMQEAIEDRLKDFSIYTQRLMIVALADDKVVGMLETYGTNRISLLFVDSEFHRKGIATNMICMAITAVIIIIRTALEDNFRIFEFLGGQYCEV